MNSPSRVHHALRHPGRAAGVEDVDVVAADGSMRVGRRASRRCTSRTPTRAVDVGGAVGRRAVVDLDQQAHPVQPRRAPAPRDRPSDVWNTRASTSALSSRYAQLVVEVAVVDVDRDAADLERGEVRLAVLGRVVEVHPDLGADTEAGIEQRLGQPGRPLARSRPTTAGGPPAPPPPGPARRPRSPPRPVRTGFASLPPVVSDSLLHRR